MSQHVFESMTCFTYIPYLTCTSSCTHELREMISNAQEWASSRGLTRRNEVHKAEEFRIPTNSSYSYTETNSKEIEKSGTLEVEDPEGSLLEFSGMSAEAALMILARMDMSINQCTCVCVRLQCMYVGGALLRNGAEGGGGNALAAASASASKQQQLPVLQQNGDPFCSLP